MLGQGRGGRAKSQFTWELNVNSKSRTALTAHLGLVTVSNTISSEFSPFPL